MILLILGDATKVRILQNALNSTVILLIWNGQIIDREEYHDFKFHCDSINMTAATTTANLQALFKFHCDSINIKEKGW